MATATKKKTGDSSLSKFRKEIDKLDDQILELLVKRARIVEEVGKVKNLANEKTSIIRPAREAKMIRRITARKHAPLSGIAVASIWRLIISSAIHIEENPRISAYITDENAEAYWMAREYFGPFTPTRRHPTSMEVVRDILEQKATVGVLPIWDKQSPKPWWVNVVESEEPPYVFARLPFVKLNPSKKSPLVAIGYVEPEPSGEDKSLWVIKADETLSFEGVIEKSLQKSLKCAFELVDQYRFLGNPTMRYYLMELEGFIEKDDSGIEKLVRLANEAHAKMTQVSAHYLGAFATPISFTDQEDSNNEET